MMPALCEGLVQADPPLAHGELVEAELDGADIVNGQFPNVVELVLDGAEMLRGLEGATRLREGLARALACFPLAGARVVARDIADERTWKLEAGPGLMCAAELRVYGPDQTMHVPSLPVSVREDAKVFGSRVLSAAAQVRNVEGEHGPACRATLVVAGCHYLFDAMTMCNFLNLWSECTQATSQAAVMDAARKWPLHKSKTVIDASPLTEAEDERLCELLTLHIHPSDDAATARYYGEIEDAMRVAAAELAPEDQKFDIPTAALRALKSFVHRKCLEPHEWASTHEIIMALVLRGLADAKEQAETQSVPYVQVINIRGRSAYFPDPFGAGNAVVREKGCVQLRERSSRGIADWVGEAVRSVHGELRGLMAAPGRVEAEYRLNAILRARGTAHKACMSRAFGDIFPVGGILFNSWVAGPWFTATFGAQKVVSIQEPAGMGHITVPQVVLVLPTDGGHGRRIILNLVNAKKHAFVLAILRTVLAEALSSERAAPNTI